MASPSRPPTNSSFFGRGKPFCRECGERVLHNTPSDLRRHNDGSAEAWCQACMHRWLDDRRLWLEQFNRDRKGTNGMDR